MRECPSQGAEWRVFDLPTELDHLAPNYDRFSDSASTIIDICVFASASPLRHVTTTTPNAIVLGFCQHIWTSRQYRIIPMHFTLRRRTRSGEGERAKRAQAQPCFHHTAAHSLRRVTTTSYQRKKITNVRAHTRQQNAGETVRPLRASLYSCSHRWDAKRGLIFCFSCLHTSPHGRPLPSTVYVIVETGCPGCIGIVFTNFSTCAAGWLLVLSSKGLLLILGLD